MSQTTVSTEQPTNFSHRYLPLPNEPAPHSGGRDRKEGPSYVPKQHYANPLTKSVKRPPSGAGRIILRRKPQCSRNQTPQKARREGDRAQ